MPGQLVRYLHHGFAGFDACTLHFVVIANAAVVFAHVMRRAAPVLPVAS
jgi:hypothetical protein